MSIQARASAAATWLLDWPIRRLLRRRGLPDIPEVRRLMRAAGQKDFTFGTAPSQRRRNSTRAGVTSSNGPRSMG